MRCLVVDMNKRALNTRQTLQLGLKILSNFVPRLKRLVWMHNNIHLDDRSRATVVCMNRVNCLDMVAICHGRIGASAVTPTSNLNSQIEVRSHKPKMKREKMIAPIGSIHHLSFDPPTTGRIPKPLMKRPFRWSSQKIRTREYLFRSAKQYRKRHSLTKNAMDTAITEGRRKDVEPP